MQWSQSFRVIVPISNCSYSQPKNELKSNLERDVIWMQPLGPFRPPARHFWVHRLMWTRDGIIGRTYRCFTRIHCQLRPDKCLTSDRCDTGDDYVAYKQTIIGNLYKSFETVIANTATDLVYCRDYWLDFCRAINYKNKWFLRVCLSVCLSVNNVCDDYERNYFEECLAFVESLVSKIERNTMRLNCFAID